jgi:hypothetical protein
MQVGRGGVEACFDAQGNACFLGLNQAFAQFLLPNQFREAFLQVRELFVDRHYFIKAQTRAAEEMR